MTLRKCLTAFALTAGLIGVTSQAKAQVTVSPGLGGVTVGGERSGAGLFIPYGGGGVQFYHPSVGAWNYSDGTISPAYSSYYTPYGNTWYGNSAYSPYGSYYTPYSNWGNTYSTYSSFYTPYGSTMNGWTYPSTTYYYPSSYYPTWGSTYYVSPDRGRRMFRR
jgi:hypothetical protein